MTATSSLVGLVVDLEWKSTPPRGQSPGLVPHRVRGEVLAVGYDPCIETDTIYSGPGFSLLVREDSGRLVQVPVGGEGEYATTLQFVRKADEAFPMGEGH